MQVFLQHRTFTLNKWPIGVYTCAVFSLSPTVFSSPAIFALPKYCMDWTNLTTDHFSYGLLWIIPSVSIFVRLRLSCDSPGWFSVMHVVALLVFFLTWLKNTALSLRHATNNHFHFRVAALGELTNPFTPLTTCREVVEKLLGKVSFLKSFALLTLRMKCMFLVLV